MAFKKPAAAAASKAPAVGGFKRGQAATAKTEAKPAARKGKSRWANVSAARTQHPIIAVGRYRVRVTANDFLDGAAGGGGPDHVKATVEIVQAADGSVDSVGDERVVLEQLGNKGLPGEARWKTFAMFSSGYDDESEYEAFAVVGDCDEYVDALLGAANDYSEAGLTNVGRLVDVTVTRGKEREGGDYFRQYAWEVVSEEEQEAEGGTERPER
jgi:hypothetical protein